MNKFVKAHISDNGRIQTVGEHCANVSEYASEEAEAIGLTNTLKLTGLLHDFGKNNEAFDQYISKANKDSKSVRRGEVNHSSAGGKYVTERYGNGDAYEKLTAQLISYAIISHHGLNDCLMIDGTDKYTTRIEPEKDIFYSEDLENSKNSILDESKIDNLFHGATKEITRIYNCILRIAGDMDSKTSRSSMFMMGCLQRMILSLLIDADRRDTAEFMVGQKNHRLTIEETKVLWKSYQEKLEKKLSSFREINKIDKLRNEMSDMCKAFASQDNGIYRLSIPTGGGKTYASMRYALEMARRTGKKHIYYVAPYLSILEQNANDIRTIFDDDEHILEHHSNVFIDTEDMDELKRYELYADDWSAPVILTTMVQFLNVLFDGGTQSVRRTHQLKNSIIIIDEAQSIPIKCINMFTTMMNYLSGCCDTTVILCTATQPLFEKVERKLLFGNPVDMIPNAEYYAKSFKRVEIIPVLRGGGYDTESLANFVMEKFEDNILIILNTKRAVTSLRNELQRRVDTNEIEITILTTYMCAKHRLDRIEELKANLKCKKIICISTQLIEAGVDISFKTVIRSLAGLDSIAQAAGRCNRNGELELGYVYIVNYNEEKTSQLVDIDRGKAVTRGVIDKYNKDLLMPDAMTMYYKQYFFERKEEMNYGIEDFSELTMYTLLSDNKIGSQNYKTREKKAFKYPLKQAYRTAGQEFEVIQKADTLTLIVPYKEGKEKIKELKQANNILEIKKIVKQLQRYTVTVFRSDPIMKSLIEKKAINQSILEGEVKILDDDYYKEGGDGISDDMSFMGF